MSNPIDSVLESTLQNLKSMIDDGSVIGKPIIYDNFTIIPVSKVTIGFVSGGGEYNSGSKKNITFPFAGGSGGGCNLTPLGFLVLSSGFARFIKTDSEKNFDKIVELAQTIISKGDNKKDEKAK